MTRFIRLHRGAQKGSAANLEGRCSHRTASKTSMPTLNEQRNLFAPVYQIHHLGELFKKYFFSRVMPWTPVDAKRVTHQESLAGLLTKGLRWKTSPPRRRQPGSMSVNTRVTRRDISTRANGVSPLGRSDSWSASSFPGPEASTQTCRAAAMAR